MSGNPCNFSVLPWHIPKSIENFVPEYSRFFVYNEYSLFFAWRSNLSLILTLRRDKDVLSSQKPLQSQIITSTEPILDILLLDNFIYFVSSSGLFQVLSSTGKNNSATVLKHLDTCKSFSLNTAFNLSAVKRVLAATSIPNHSLQNGFAVITCAQDNGTLNAEIYSVSQNSTSQVDSHLEFSSNIYSDRSPLDAGRCTCHFLEQSQATTLFSDCKDADVLLVGLSSGQLFCVPFLLTAKKLGIRLSPRLIFQSHWSIIGLTYSPDVSNIFVFLQGGTVLKISPVLNRSMNSNSIPLSFNSFTLSHPVKCYSAPTCEQLIVSDGFNTSLIHLLAPDQTQVDMISVKGITTMSSVLEDNLIIASSSHSIFYLLNPASTLFKEEQSHFPWAGCDLDLSLQLVQEMQAQTAILSEVKNKLKEEDGLIKALSSVSRSPLMAKFFTIDVKVFGNHEEQSGQSSETTDSNDFLEKTYTKFVISIQINNNSPEDFPSSLWKMSLEFRSADGLAATRHIPLTRTFSSDFPFCARFNIPFAVEISSLPLEVKAYLLAEIKENKEKREWLKMSLATAVLDVSHFVSAFSQAPQVSCIEAYDIADCVNQIHSPMSGSDSQTDDLQERCLVSCVIPVPEEFRQHSKIVDKILSNCTHCNSAIKNKHFYEQGDKTVIWLKFSHKTLNIVLRKSCSSITISSAHLDFFHCFKLHLTSIFKDCKSDCDNEHDVACTKAKNLNAVLETLSLEEALDHKKILAIYQDLRNNVSPQMY
ncbi:uncharacterized protein LOC117641647 [Thrips palmi]|uniref:Uncharacterized protein LOC117641647 n=1 Tax=Thrips palmi TaxID=161013 RepID=A0A6P8Y600_THRPL|nr:uncharacterized protein LOC117641647 [Thrips palmi]